MATFFPPPPPFMGGAQPHAPRKLPPALSAVQVDNPPFTYGGPVALKAEAAAIAQPDPWTFSYFAAGQPFAPRKLSPGIPGQSVDNPPFTFGGPVAVAAEIVTSSQPDWSVKAWPYVFMGRGQPYAGRVASPRLISVAVDNPPFSHPGRGPIAASIVAGWQPPAPIFYLELYASKRTPQRLRPTARGYIIL